MYSAALGTFVPLPQMPLQLPAQLCSAAKALQAVDQGKYSTSDACLSSTLCADVLCEPVPTAMLSLPAMPLHVVACLPSYCSNVMCVHTNLKVFLSLDELDVVCRLELCNCCLTRTEQLLSYMGSATAILHGHRGSPLCAGCLTAGCSLSSHLAIGVGWLAGADWSTLNPPHSWPRQERSKLYGKNDMSAGKPSVWSMAAKVLTMPLFLIQVSSLSEQFDHQFLH